MSVRILDVYHQGVYWDRYVQHNDFSAAPYTWKATHRATGAAAECARAALAKYAGKSKTYVVRCIRAAEKFATQKWVDPVVADTHRKNLRVTHITGKMRVAKRAPTVYATVAAQYAVESILKTSGASRLEAVTSAINATLWAGVTHDECARIFAKWVVKDLTNNTRIGHSLRHAAIAAAIVGEYNVAKDILI